MGERAPSVFRGVYESPWHNPAAFWAVSIGFLAWWMRRKAFLTAFVVLFLVEIVADALFKGGWASPAFAAWPLATPISIAFVILGDFRYFLLVERYASRPGARAHDATPGRAWAAAGALSLLVPLLSAAAIRVVPERFAEPRATYLAYEAMFVALALFLRFFWLPRRLAAAPAAVRAWLLRLTGFELAQYTLWALADVIILSGADAGFALRLLPNAMYYAFFVPFVALTAPPEVDA